MIKISIIVPVYNVEKFLSECIESILAQSFQDYEVLLVDDGSFDNSGSICDKYAETNSRIRVFHKKNGGVSSARNLGLKYATGKWITFIDSDDIVGSDFLKGLYNPILRGFSVDFVHGGCSNLKKGTPLTINQSYDNYIGNDKGRLFSSFRGLAVSKLFKTEIIRENGLMFDESMKIAEDMAFTMDYLFFVEDYAFTDTTCYFYRQDNDESATHRIKHLSYDLAHRSFIHLYESTVSYVNLYEISSEESRLRFKQRAEQYLRMLKSMYYGGVDKKQRLGILESESKSVYFNLLDYILPTSRLYRDAKFLKNRQFCLYDIYQQVDAAMRLTRQRVIQIIKSFVMARR